ncbi:sensor histidine kinase [Metabacillus idriensis]|uniref:sensor histidine kinase n=1 Tax=Metabacillus idriensis TaxID=324768 RepID=UPI00174866F5|nr:HAMP domain-containing sensor histidine kinase [Metabacillus idriensis]
MTHSLYLKFVWFTLITMIISSFTSFFVMNTYYHQFLKKENDKKNAAIASEMSAYLEGLTSDQMSDALKMLGSAGYQLYIEDQSGSGSFYGGEYRDKTLPKEVISSVIHGEVYHGMRDYPRETFVTGFFANELKNSVGVQVEADGTNYALFIRPNIGMLFGELRLLFGGLAIGLLLLSIFGMIIAARKLIHPISHLTNVTKKMAAESFDEPINISRRDEIGQLAESFDAMRLQMKQLMTKRKEFVNNVSHDIQSPLHTIQSYLALLKKPDVTKEEQIAYQNIIQQETSRLSELTKQLLALTVLDESLALQDQEMVSINKQWLDTINRYRWKLEEKEMSLSHSLKAEKIKGNAALLLTVWENLISNAVKYSEQGGSIHIETNSREDQVTIMICDEGIGMSEEEKKQAFERFYRADKARTRKTEGTGLGLSIVKEIIHLHQGSILIESEPQKGTSITISLPRGY